MVKERKAILFLRLGLALAFIYTAVASFLNPLSWSAFIPEWLKTIFSVNFLLSIHHLFNILIAIWLLSGRKIFYAAIISGLNLFLIIIFNLKAFDIFFRDTAILFSAIALAILTFKEK